MIMKASFANYEIIPELGLITESYTGITNISDVIRVREKFNDDENYSSSFNRLTDFRNTRLKMNHDDIMSFIKYSRDKMVDGDIIRHSAILTSTPNETAISYLLRIKQNGLPFLIEVYSTVEAALRWIKVPQDKKYIVEAALERSLIKSSY